MIIPKTREEIELMRASSLLVSKTLGMIAKEINPGVTTLYLDKLAEEFIRDHGGVPAFLGLYGFPNSLCMSPNAQVVHGIPNNKPLESGEVISVYCGVLMNEFYGDHAYTFEIGEVAPGVVPYFNSPKIRANIALNNSGFLFNNRLGFSANMHYQDGFNYESTFAVGKISAYQTVDAVLTFKVPSYRSLIKAGGTNIFNKYYRTAYGSPQIGGLYYVSFAYNVF